VNSLIARIERMTLRDSATGCWLWIGAKRGGYAAVGVNENGWKMKAVHILNFERYRGPVPDGSELDHRCRVKHCTNPEHLELVTHKENIVRAFLARPIKTHCKWGHELTPENVIRSGHQRDCRSCNRRRALERYHRSKSP